MLNTLTQRVKVDEQELMRFVELSLRIAGEEKGKRPTRTASYCALYSGYCVLAKEKMGMLLVGCGWV